MEQPEREVHRLFATRVRARLGTERARLGAFRGLEPERSRLGSFRGLGTERARLGPFRGLGTKSQKNVIFLPKKSIQPPKN